ncbi:MAG: hypothetical protein QM770_09725 [Tepidisphaeraceae bacterium]
MTGSSTARTKPRPKRTARIRKPGDTTDILKLGSGPFPIPIGQSPEEVHRQFEVNALPPETQTLTGKTMPGHLVVELRPRKDTRLAGQMESITIWIDPKLKMPVVIQTLDKDGTTIRATTLRNLRLNEPVTPEDFKLEPVEGWQVIQEPLKD